MNITNAQLTARIEYWKRKLPELGISHWRVEEVAIVDETPGGPDADATVGASSYYDSARFYFTRGFLNGATKEQLDATIIHEWMHVVMRDHDDVLESVQTWMPQQTYNDFAERVDHTREGIIERCARLIHRLHTDNK